MDDHDWSTTVVAELLRSSVEDPDGSDKRFATMKGMAFAAHDTADGTWHDYPVPWNDVPTALKDVWLQEKLVTRRDFRRYGEFASNNVDWPLESDDG